MAKEPGFFKPLGDSETRYVMSLKREIERLRGKVSAMQSRIEMQAGDAKRLVGKIERIEAAIGELFHAMTANGGNRNHTPEKNERLVTAWAVLRDMNAAAKEQTDVTNQI